MAHLYGKDYSRQELARRMGLMEQAAGIRLIELADGWGRGVRAALLRTGSGLSATVLIDRGLDIYDADYKGAALAWVSPTGPKHPAYFEEPGFGWLRSFYGGLVVTCGLSTAGAPSVDQGEPLGIHGRYSHTPAGNVHVGSEWRGDEYIVFIEGEMREARVFNENLLLKRRIEIKAGGDTIGIFDTVSNEGFQRRPHMMLYHCNLGFPVVDDGSRLLAPSKTVTPRDDVAKPGIKEYDRFSAPVPGYQEQVFYHDMRADKDGYVKVGVANPAFNGGKGLAVYARYRQRELPRFAEWKMVGEDVYTVGLEPANCLVEGRAKERERGELQFLAPGEQRSYHLEIGVEETATL
jgi:hypothetical protein